MRNGEGRNFHIPCWRNKHYAKIYLKKLAEPPTLSKLGCKIYLFVGELTVSAPRCDNDLHIVIEHQGNLTGAHFLGVESLVVGMYRVGVGLSSSYFEPRRFVMKS